MNRGIENLRYLWQSLSGWRVRHEKVLADLRQTDVIPYLGDIRSARILDLANGRLRPQTSLLLASGCQVYGIDLVNHPAFTWIDRSYQILRWIYNRQASHSAIAPNAARLVCGNVDHLPYAGNSFDLVTSVAAFEHFLNVPQVIGELQRVLRPGGLAWVCIHPFTCPSGAHNVTLTEVPLRSIPKEMDAWDHLRKRRLPFDVPLNEWRIGQYVETFAAHFEILKHYCALHEGEFLLSPQIMAELSGYRREELTCLAYVIVARKA